MIHTDNLQKEIERLRSQVIQLEKKSSLGTLCAGIVHEIRNPLNFILNFNHMSEKLLEELEETIEESKSLNTKSIEEIKTILKELRCNLERVTEHGTRAANILKDVLMQTRQEYDEAIPSDPVRLSKEYIWLCYHAMRAEYKDFNTCIRENYPEKVSTIKLIPQYFSCIITNLVNNACYAVWKKKQNKNSNYHPEIQITLTIQNGKLYWVIEDNGIGMSSEVQQKLYDAFFTTKPSGQGTGLGLHLVYETVKTKLNGSISFASEPGKYTRFTVEFPIIQ